MITAAGNRPKLAILTTVLRADFHHSLSYFRRFEVWHFYHQLAQDIAPEELGPRTIRFHNLFDLLVNLQRLKPDLIQGGEPYDFPSQLPLIVATLVGSKLLRVPYFFPTFEIIPPEEKFAEIKRWGIPLTPLLVPFIKWLARLYSSQALIIFACNKGSAENFRRLGIPESKICRLLYATWGVDIDIFSPVPEVNARVAALRKTAPSLSGEQKISNGSFADGREEVDMGAKGILFVGRLIEMKGVLVLLSAFAEVKKRFPDAQLFIIGEGPLKDEICRRAKLAGLSTSVHILGTVLNQQLAPFFRSAWVTVSPSITTRRMAEQVGMVNIQSIACGTPVVSTRSGAIPEFIPDGQVGLLVSENDVTALTEAITLLLSDRELHQRLARNARAYAVEHYDARRNVEKVENLLWQILTRRG